MPFLFIYLLKLSVSLAVVFTFYQFVLRKLTFYNWNRCYLLGYSLLSFFIALVDIAPVLDQNEWAESSIVQWVPVIQSGTATETAPAVASSLDAWQWLCVIILSGTLIMLLRLLIQYLSFRRMVRKAEPIHGAMLPGSNMKLYQVNEDIIPFSFGNSIFINHHLHTADELREIVWHEFIHVKQKHSFDIIAGEILCMLNWYNPFAWLLRRSIRQNLEFIADDKVLENGVDRKEYQYLLLKVIGNKHFSIAPKFNFSSLKKRIAMMNKMKSAGVHIVKFLFILPLIAVLLVAFRNGYSQSERNQPLENPLSDRSARVDTVPYVTTPNSKGYLIDVIGVDGECTVVVKDKKGKEIERVILNQWKEQRKFEEQYGEILAPPPQTPAPPSVAVAPISGVATMPPTPPADPLAPIPANLFECYGTTTPAPAVAGTGYNLSRTSEEWEITDKKAVIKLRNGKTEKYDLTDPKQKAGFEQKYGKLIYVNTNINTTATTAVHASGSNNVNTVITIPPGATTVNTNLNATVSPVAVVNGESSFASTAPMPAGMATNVIDPYGHLITGEEDIVITITRNTTRQELDKFIAQMKEKGVELNFEDIEFNEKGKLVSINGTMKSGGSRSNFVAADFATLTLAMIKKGEKVYFKVGTKEKEVS